MRRLNVVTVRLGNASVDIPWDSRNALLGRLSTDARARRIAEAFESVGTSRPVVLSDSDGVVLLDNLDAWWTAAKGKGLPDGISELRVALASEIRGE
jgi:hypothetical protein